MKKRNEMKAYVFRSVTGIIKIYSVQQNFHEFFLYRNHFFFFFVFSANESLDSLACFFHKSLLLLNNKNHKIKWRNKNINKIWFYKTSSHCLCAAYFLR